LRPPVETGGWNIGKSAFADCGGGILAGGVGRGGTAANTACVFHGTCRLS